MLEEIAQDILDVGMNASTAGATRTVVRLTENAHTDRLTVLIADNGKGMSPDLRRRVLDGFTTTKTGSGKPLGLGIAMLREATELCEGRFHLFSREGEGTIVAARMQRSHIDRPPLGDIAGSITALCCAGGEADVDFEYRVGRKAFRFDSRQVLDSDRRHRGISAPILLEIERILHEGVENLRTGCPDPVSLG